MTWKCQCVVVSMPRLLLLGLDKAGCRAVGLPWTTKAGINTGTGFLGLKTYQLEGLNQIFKSASLGGMLKTGRLRKTHCVLTPGLACPGPSPGAGYNLNINSDFPAVLKTLSASYFTTCLYHTLPIWGNTHSPHGLPLDVMWLNCAPIDHSAETRGPYCTLAPWQVTKMTFPNSGEWSCFLILIHDQPRMVPKGSGALTSMMLSGLFVL